MSASKTIIQLKHLPHPRSSRNHRSSRPNAVSIDYPVTRINSPRPSTLYDILRVDHTATQAEIKVAYRSLAKIYHPDTAYPESDGAADFIQINEAYAVLSDPAARAHYDYSINKGATATAPHYYGYSATAFHPTRRWETDQCW